MPKGKRQDVAELIVATLEYDSAGKYRLDLTGKMIYAQIALAKAGFSTGGRAPFGFRRWLAKEDGSAVRQLADGERVRMAHHHVVLLPGPKEDLVLIYRILAMLESMPAARVRKDRGITHRVSGVWHQTTIINIARNPLLGAMVQYGVRSMGGPAALHARRSSRT